MNRPDSPILKDFHAWLVMHGSSVRSADSYCCAIRKIEEAYWHPRSNGRDLFDLLEHSALLENATTMLYCIEGFISEDVASSKGAQKKSLQDKRCKLRRFIDFLSQPREESVKLYPQGRLASFIRQRLLEGVVVRDAKTIIEEISGTRYEGLFKNAGIVNADGKVPDFYGIFISIIDKTVMSARFVTPNQVYTLQDIDYLKIVPESRAVYIIVKGHTLPLLYTHRESTLHPMKRKDLKSLRLNGFSTEKAVCDNCMKLKDFVASGIEKLKMGSCESIFPNIPKLIVLLHQIMPNIKFTIN